MLSIVPRCAQQATTTLQWYYPMFTARRLATLKISICQAKAFCSQHTLNIVLLFICRWSLILDASLTLNCVLRVNPVNIVVRQHTPANNLMMLVESEMGRGQVNRRQYTKATPHSCLQQWYIDMTVYTVAFAIQTHVRLYKRQSYRHKNHSNSKSTIKKLSYDHIIIEIWYTTWIKQLSRIENLKDSNPGCKQRIDAHALHS